MRKKTIILVAACIMIVVVIFLVFFVFRTPTQTTEDPYFVAYYNEFNKTPKIAFNYSFSPPVSMYRALLIALITGGWNATSLKNWTIDVELDYCAFTGSPSVIGVDLLYPVTHSVVDWSPQQINDTTTYRYAWAISVITSSGGGRFYYIDAATAELVFTGGIIPGL